MSVRREAWLVGGASVRGAAHIRSGRPNQDAVRWLPEAGDGARVVGAVADGHGGAPHFRSDQGARIAVDRTVDILAWRIDEAGDQEEAELAAELLRAWRDGVAAHLSQAPYAPADPVAPERPLMPYGATLLTFAAAPRVIELLQIGDGDVVLGFARERMERPLGRDSGMIGEETYSLCLADAERRARSASLWRDDVAEWPDFVLLATDGVSKSFRDDGAFLEAVAQLRRLAAAQWDATVEALPEWLERVSAAGSGDDSTVCIAMRRH
jgi:serine/threonine protein phosphatase PrpC